MTDNENGALFVNLSASSFAKGMYRSPQTLVTPRPDASSRPRLLQPSTAVSLKVAETDEDRATAYELIREAYAEAGYVDAAGFSIPESYHSANTRTFVLSRDGTACGTFTIIPDGTQGLVMESIYGQELAQFRGTDRFLGEVSGLAFGKALTGDERATSLLYLYQTAYLFSRLTGITDLLIAVNPHHSAFYERSLLFDSFAEFRTYSSLKEAPAVAKRLHMPSWPGRLYAKYGRPEEDRPQRFPMDSLLRVLVEALQDSHIPPGLDLELLPSLVAPNAWTHSHASYSGPPPHPLLTAGTSAA